MGSCEKLPPFRRETTRPIPEIVRTRKYEIPVQDSSCPSPLAQPRRHPDRTLTHKNQADWTRHDGKVREDRFMVKHPGEVRTGKLSRLENYHHDTPVPLRYQDRLSYSIPNGTSHSTPAQNGSYFGLTQSNSAFVPPPRIDHQSGRSDSNWTPSDYKIEDYKQSEAHQGGYRSGKVFGERQFDSRMKGHNLEPSRSYLKGCGSASNASTNIHSNKLECQRLDTFCNRPFDDATRKESNKSNTRIAPQDMFLDCGSDQTSTPSTRNPLHDFFPTSSRSAELQIHNKGSINGLESNVDEIGCNGDLSNGTQPDFVAYSKADYRLGEIRKAQPTRVQNYNHDDSIQEGVDLKSNSGMRKNANNLKGESPFAQRSNDKHFLSSNGVTASYSPPARRRLLMGNAERHKKELAVPVKQGFVAVLNSDQIKKCPEQRRDNTRSVVELVLTSNRPNEENEADNFITLIDESFSDYYADKDVNKRCVAENLRIDRAINSVNKGIESEGATRFGSNKDKAVCTVKCREKPALEEKRPRSHQGTGRIVTVSSTCKSESSLQQSTPPSAAYGSEDRRECSAENASFEEIRKQLFNEAGLDHVNSDVIGEKTNSCGDLSIVRTVHQSVGSDRHNGGERNARIDDDFVFIVNESAGRLAHNNDKNPKADAILKTPRTHLKANRNNKSPFIRTVYQDCGFARSTDSDVNTCGRPVSPFSDSIITAVVACSSGREGHELLHLRRRDRQLRYLSEPGIFRNSVLRMNATMDGSCSNSSCGEAESFASFSSGSDRKGSELTEHALRAHTMALKASSPNIRRRPTLNQFFGKISEQGLQDNLSEHSDLSCHSDSVLMVQRANKVNLSPLSGLVKDGSPASKATSRAKRLKAWKSRHENIFKGARTTSNEATDCTTAALSRVSEDCNEAISSAGSSRSLVGTCDKDAVDGKVSSCKNTAFDVNARSVECTQFQGDLDKRNFEGIPESVMGDKRTNDEDASGFSAVYDGNDNYRLACINTVSSGGGLSSANKSVESDDSFEEVFVEPELISCTRPFANRKQDSQDSADGTNRDDKADPESVFVDAGVKKDSLDVFVGSASAILERVKRLKLKYNHKSTSITSYDEEKDLNCNFVSNANTNCEDLEKNSQANCLIPSPTLLKDSPRVIKTLDKSDAFSRSPGSYHCAPDSQLNTKNVEKKSKVDSNKSKGSSSSWEELYFESNRSPFFSFEEDTYHSPARKEVHLNVSDSLEAQELLKCLDKATETPSEETMDKFNGTCGPQFVKKKRLDDNGEPPKPVFDTADVFVCEKDKGLTSGQRIVTEKSSLKREGRVDIDLRPNAVDEEGLEELSLKKCLEVQEAEYTREVSKQIDDRIASRIEQNPHDLQAEGKDFLEADEQHEQIAIKAVTKEKSSVFNDHVNESVLLCDKDDAKNNMVLLARNKESNVDEGAYEDVADTSSVGAMKRATGDRLSSEMGHLAVDVTATRWSDLAIANSNNLNVLSGTFEEIGLENGEKITHVINKDDNIESEEFSHLGGELSSKADVIINESKDHSSEMVTFNGFQRDFVGGDLQPAEREDATPDENEGLAVVETSKDLINLNDGAAREDGKAGKLREKEERALINATEDFFDNDVNNSRCADVGKVVTRDSSENGMKYQVISPERKFDCEGKASVELNQISPSINIDEFPCASRSPKEKVGAIERYKLVNTDDVCFFDEGDGSDSLTDDSGVDMAHAKGVLDLKKHFEKYQPKGDKKADGTASRKVQVSNDSTRKDEHGDSKSTVASARPSKFGALKSMFEEQNAPSPKVSPARITSPKPSRSIFAVKNTDTRKEENKEKNSPGIVTNHVGMLIVGNPEREEGANEEEMQSSKAQAPEDEKNNGSSVEGAQQDQQQQKGDVAFRKLAKVPPPVRRKPSLKKAKEASKTISTGGLNSGAGTKADPANQTSQVTLKARHDSASLHSTEKSGTQNSVETANAEHHVAVNEQPSSCATIGNLVAVKERVSDESRARSEDQNIIKEVDKKVTCAVKQTDAEEIAAAEERLNTDKNLIVEEKQNFANDVAEAVEEGVGNSLLSEVCNDTPGIGVVDYSTREVLSGQSPRNSPESIVDLRDKVENTFAASNPGETVKKCGSKDSDTTQLKFDRFADKKNEANKEQKKEQSTDDERGSENSKDEVRISASPAGKETVQRNVEMSGLEEGERSLSRRDEDRLVIDIRNPEECNYSEREENADVDVNSFPGRTEATSKQEQLKNFACKNNLTNESSLRACKNDVAMDLGLDVRRSEDQKSRQPSENRHMKYHPICGLENSRNLVTSDQNELKGSDAGTIETRDGCDESQGKPPCSNDNGLSKSPQNSAINLQRQSKLSSRSLSNSSDSSLEDVEPIKLKEIDYDNLPTVGLPAMLQEPWRGAAPNDTLVEENRSEQQREGKSQYVSYSQKASDIKSHSVIIGMYSKPCEEDQTCSSKDAFVSKESEEIPTSAMQYNRIRQDLEVKQDTVENEAMRLGLTPKDVIGSVNGDLNLGDNQGSFDSCPVSIAYKSPKSRAPIVIQSQALTSERSNSPNIAKVSPYFHDRCSTRFTEPVSKFGGGIFGDAWVDDQSTRVDGQCPEMTENEKSIGRPLMRNKESQGQTLSDLKELSVILKVPKEDKREESVNLGMIKVDGMSHWQEVENEVSRLLKDHLGGISDDGLGITSRDIESLEFGKHKVGIGEGRKLMRYSKEDDVNTCSVHLQENWTQSTALLAYQLLIPKKILEKYLSLAVKHRCLVFCGPSGTGKSYLASKIAFALVSRISSNLNNNSLDPIHSVNVNADRWKEIRKIVKQRVSQAMPVVLVIDGFTPEFHDSMDNLSVLLKQVESKQFYVVAALNQTTHEVNVQWQNSIRWIWLDNNEEPVSGFLVRYLKKKFSNNNERCNLKELFEIAEWVSSLWKHLNSVIEKFHSAEQAIGPAMFFSCPPAQSEIDEWFADMWNYSLAPYILHTMRTGVKMFGQRCEWMDPLEWISNTYPWPHRSSHRSNLKRIRKSDVGYWDMNTKERDANASSADQIRLLNFLRRLETLVDNKIITTDTKPGSTQRRIYLESTL